MSSLSNKILVPVLLVVILGGGVATGIALDRLWLRPEPARTGEPDTRRRPRLGQQKPAWLVQRFKQRLHLNEGQTKAVQGALEEMFAGLRAIRKKTRAERQAIRKTARARITRVLTPAQQKAYQEMVQRYEERRARRPRRRR